MKADCAIIGGGIVGLSVAMTLLRRQPGLGLVVLEKESALASHQSGRNSGVIHSGIYYQPGTLKARFARDGNRSLVRFCKEEGIHHQRCGKIIVATRDEELPLLEELRRRGESNGLEVSKLCPAEVAEIEPHVRCLAGLRVPAAAIVDFREVCAAYARIVRSDGGVVRTSSEALTFRSDEQGWTIETDTDEVHVTFLVNCGGLQSDRIARRTGIEPPARIIPFRGEYYELAADKRKLVRALVYPVPDPSFPFLGVHLTKMIDGSVHAGPNAVLAFRREGYRWTDIGVGTVAEIVSYPGFWKLARKHYQAGWNEIRRSLSKRLFLRSVQQLLPEIEERDLVPGPAGVRAQALQANGRFVEDFLILHGPRSLHICNAPSPAATASLEIAAAVVDEIPELRRVTIAS
jgi:L-2-hydroxyglutarate oxidase